MSASQLIALLLEADPIVALDLEACLLEAGWDEVVAVATLAEAEAEVERRTFDVAVISRDEVTPRVAGLLRRAGCASILLTTDDAAHVAAMAIRPDHILAKPFSSVDLGARARALAADLRAGRDAR